MRKKSIQTKLLEVFVIVSLLVFVVNAYIFYNQNKAIKEIDSVYNSNIQLNKMSTSLDNLQTSLYQYLSTKSSDVLENYYTYEQEYKEEIEGLNRKIVNAPNKLTEKNIYYVSQSYLEKADATIEAKRGRNIGKYKESYVETEELYDYIRSSVNSMNVTVFLQNSHNYSLLRSALNSLIWVSLMILLAVMAIAIGWIVLMTRNITKPLIELADAANEIARGNMEVAFPIVETNDEISTVAKACNKMIDSIRVYIQKTKENYEREGKLVENELIMKNDLKEAQLKYLQAQINPHFLFNSLNAAAQLAMMEGAEKACIFIENMAEFFRYNVRKADKATTLEEELTLADNYIYILNVRFAGDIHYQKHIDERWLSVEMPGMILQPILENAINHGIRDMQGMGRIETSVYSDGEDICIEIKDNGAGISPEIAGRILHGESIHSENEADSAGIGMDNVISRLRRYYGRDRVMDIKGIETGGTKITIFIPKETEAESYDENTNL